VPVVDELAAVLVAAGDDGFLNALARFTRLGDDACAALLAMVAGEVEPPPTGAPGAHPRDVMEDVMDLVVVAAGSGRTASRRSSRRARRCAATRWPCER
jgi:hypothetical protein